MKAIFTSVILLGSIISYGQQHAVHSIKDFSERGYIDGVRLDSLAAGYAVIDFRDGSLVFNYGQGAKKRDMFVTDQRGRRLYQSVERNSVRMFWINFLDHNGWEYLPDSTSMLFKKRQPVQAKVSP